MKTFEEVLACVAEEALRHELQMIFRLGLCQLSPSDDNIKKWNDEISAYNSIREEIEHGGKLVYIDKPAWTIFDYDRFKFNKDDGFETGHDNFDTTKFLEAYCFEDHYFYLAWIKGYDTPMKIKMHMDPSSHIEIVSLSCRNTNDNSCIYFWDWPEKFLAFMSLPELPTNLKEERFNENV